QGGGAPPHPGEEAGRLLRFYEDALRGYTYLEEPEMY
ncbi:MAG: hypothetical protein KY475_17695, partial [Planctomycetes bacterium]|nr:hypothetical protein [Planctomycetota bacterium]